MNICPGENVGSKKKPKQKILPGGEAAAPGVILSLDSAPLLFSQFDGSKKAKKPTKSPLGRAGISSSLCVSPRGPQSQGPVLIQALLPLLPPLSLRVQIKAQRVPAQLSAEESDSEKQREKAGQEMPSGSQDLE